MSPLAIRVLGISVFSFWPVEGANSEGGMLGSPSVAAIRLQGFWCFEVGGGEEGELLATAGGIHQPRCGDARMF